MLYVKNLYKSYQVGKTDYPVLKGISLQVAQGEFTAVMDLQVPEKVRC